MNAPREPDVSCPHLDSAIEEIEKARNIHEQLRKWGNYWKDKCENLEENYQFLEKQKEEEIQNLEDKIQDLESQQVT